MVKPKKRTRTKEGSTLYFMFEQRAQRAGVANRVVTAVITNRFVVLVTDPGL